MDKRSVFKQIISQIESSGGKNKQHKKIKHGIHKGHTAGGEYGLMPNTVDEMLRRDPIPYTLEEAKRLQTLSPDEKTQMLNEQPGFEEHIADKIERTIERNVGEDELKKAAAWNQGHNLKSSSPMFKTDKYKNLDYVKKYKTILDQLERNIAAEDINKLK